MNSYYIPSNKLKGESRILYIFTTKSLIYTAAGAGVGLLFYLPLMLIGLKIVGIIIMIALAALGYGIGAIKMPTGGNSKLAKNVGGESIDQIIIKYINFKRNKKVYSYSVPRVEPNYQAMNPLSFITGRKDSKNEGGNK